MSGTPPRGKGQGTRLRALLDGRIARLEAELEKQMVRELKEQGDPRMDGEGHIFDEFKYANRKGVGFYRRFILGEKMNAGWVNKSDFEEGPLD